MKIKEMLRRLAPGAAGPARQPATDRGDARVSDEAITPQQYWTEYNVTLHESFESAGASIEYLRWRNSLYFDYERLMPVTGVDGKVVLDFGCGPGHDVVGFAVSGSPAHIIGMDVSPTSLTEARERLALHGGPVEFVKIEESDTCLPLGSQSVDLIHSSGVLHHTPDPLRILREFRRVLKPDGHAQVMVYNYDSVWMHLLVNYLHRLVERKYAGLSKREAFTKSTDGPDCPISECYRPGEWIELARDAGFEARLRGVAVSTTEMSILPRRFDALNDRRLDPESREFLCALRFDDRGVPMIDGRGAGVDGCYEMRAC